MSYGIEMKSPFGTEIIDGNRIAGRVWAKYTITCAGFHASLNTIRYGGIDITGLPVGNPILVCGDSRFHLLDLAILSSTSWRITAYVESGASTSIDVWLLMDTAPVAPVSGDYGIEIFNASGVRQFATTGEGAIGLLGDTLCSKQATDAAVTVNITNPTGRDLMLSTNTVAWIGVKLVDAGSYGVFFAGMVRVASQTQIQYRYRSVMIGPSMTGFDQGFSNYLPIFLK